MAYSFDTPFGNVHQGSWGILPDFGLTERLPQAAQNAVGAPLSQPQEVLGQSTIQPGPQSIPNAPMSIPGAYVAGPQVSQTQSQPQISGGGNGGGGGTDWGAVENAYRAMGWNDMNAARADALATNFSKVGQGQGPSPEDRFRQEIENIFNPAMNALGDVERNVRAGAQAELGNIGQTYQRRLGELGPEAQALQANLANQKQMVQQGASSAADEAKRQFLALQQQARSRFGGSSSTGPAVQELAAQEFYRQQGKLNQGLTQAFTQLGEEGTKVGMYIDQKKNAWDQWKQDAEQKIKSNLDERINEITMRKGELESNKAQMRLQALQDAANNLREIQNRDNQLRTQLATWGIEQAQAVAGRAFTPAEIANTWNAVFTQPYKGIGTSPMAQSVQTSFRPGGASKTQEDILREQGLIL